MLDELDTFFASKVEERCRQRLTVAEERSLEDLDSVARRFAARWLLIALSRPMDTLAITLRDPDSPFSRELYGLGSALSDFVDLE